MFFRSFIYVIIPNKRRAYMKNDYSLLIKKRIGPVIFFVTAFLLYKLAFLFPETVENVYSRGIYPVFATVFSH